MNRMPSTTTKNEQPEGWEHLPPALRMAAMAGKPKRSKSTFGGASGGTKNIGGSSSSSTPKRSKSTFGGGSGSGSGGGNSATDDDEEHDKEEKKRSLKEDAEAMRQRLAGLGIASNKSSVAASPTTSSPKTRPKTMMASKAKSKTKPLPAAALSPTAKASASSSGYDIATLKKKLAKVEKLLAKEEPGSKDYKKLLKKQSEYRLDIAKLESENHHEDIDDHGNSHSRVNDNDCSSSSILSSTERAAEERKEKARVEARRLREEAEQEAAAAAALVEEEKEDLARAAEEAEEKKRYEEANKRLAEEKKREAEEEEARREEAENARRNEERRLRQQKDDELTATQAVAAEERRLREEQDAAEVAERAAKELQEKVEENRRKDAEVAAASKLEEERRQKKLQEEENVEAGGEDEEAEEEWDVVRVIPTEEEIIICRTEGCGEQAVVIWASSLDPGDEWPVCEDCQLADFGGWPEGVFPIHRSGDTGDDSEEVARLIAEQEEERRLEEIREKEERERQEEEENERRAERERRSAERAEAEAAKVLKEKEEPSKEFLDRRSIPEPYSNNTKKILKELENLETRHKKLEKSLAQNGIPITEDIPYEVAKDKIAEISKSMKELATADIDPYKMEKQYFILEEQLAKYSTALMLTDEYAEEQKRIEQEWEDSLREWNIAALEKLRSHMPVNIRSLTEEELSSIPSPNGKILPKAFARKFKRTNVLQLIRVNPDDIERMHPSLLESMRTTGLTLTERSALHQHLRDVASRWEEKQSDPSCEKKWQWFQGLKMKFKEMMNAYTACVDKWGPPGEHRYANRDDPAAGGCPLLGNQCPLRADAVMDYSDNYGYSKDAEFEGGSSVTASSSTLKRSSTSTSVQSSKPKISEDELTNQLRERLQLDDDDSEVDKKLLRELFHAEKKARSLEKQLTQAGLTLPQEDISYSVAKEKISELTEELKKVAASMGSISDDKEIAKLETEFGKLSQELDKYNNAIMLTKEWAREQEDKERQWEMSVSPGNYACLQQVWRHMPVNIKDLSEVDLTCQPTPSGKTMPKQMAKKFKRTNILMLLRMDPASIEPMHPSSLEALRTTGLTLTERRALHEHLKDLAPKWKSMSSDKMAERKWMWHESLRSKLKEMLEKYDNHIAEYGPPGNHPYAKHGEQRGDGCPLLGNQCPLKADLATDYTGDYGFPDEAQYDVQAVAKSNLLSIEDLERRKREDEVEHGEHGSSGPVPSPNADRESVSTLRPAIGGMLAGIKRPQEIESEPAAVLARPALSGILAEIGSKKAPVDSNKSSPAPRPPGGAMGGLLAAIRKRG